MQTNLTAGFVARAAFTPDPAQPGKDRELYWDTNLRGFGLMVTAAGRKSYVVQYRANRTSRRLTIDGVLPLDKARRQAKAILGAVAKGHDPIAEKRAEAAAKADTLQSICEEYLAQPNTKKLRTVHIRRQMLARFVYKPLGPRQITEIKRSDIARLLDHVEAQTSAIQADSLLALIRKIFNWYAARSDDFNSPIRPGMARTTPRQLARDRILTDDELRAVWTTALHYPGPWGQFVRYLLLTATRRDETADMERAELVNGEWTIPADRYKTKTEVTFPLSAAAQAVLAELPAFGTGELFFTTNGKAPIQGFSKFKETFDKACGVTGWRLHDLRRTARSLMARAGVPADHAERCLGHVIPGVRGTYDRHQYIEEMRRAFEALAAQIERIVNPTDNVVALRG